MPALAQLTEDSLIAFIQNTPLHGQNVGIVPRRYNQTKFDNETLNPVTLPAIVVQAVQNRMLHTKLAVFMFDVEIVLTMQADDTNAAAWDAAAGGLENILMVDDLAAYLQSAIPGFYCGGVVNRTLGSLMAEERHWKRVFGLQLWTGKA